LYDTERFAREGIDPRFHKAPPTPYPQFGHDFVPFLSIIDMMMFNGAEGTAKLLCNCDLLTKEEIRRCEGPIDVYGWRNGEANLSKRCRS
jgi:hypothetical protein